MISKRIINMTPSATVELTAKVAELKKTGIDVISFNIGEPDFGTPNNINLAAKRAIDEGFTKYTAAAGIIELREAICEKLKTENKVIYSPNQISVGTGAKQSLVNTILTICDKDDEILLPTPCWVSYIEMIKLAEGKPILIPCIEENGFAPDLSAIEKAITPKTKAILLNTPNNPTGAVYNINDLKKICELALKYNFYIISDEIYEKLIYDGEKHFCIASLTEAAKNRTITINGFSKAYAMTGWRIGYAAGPADVIKGINSLQGHMTSNTNSITQKAAIEALKGPQQPIYTMIEEFDKRRKYLINRISNINDITCSIPKGAFYVMPNVKKLFCKKHNGKELKDSFGVANYLLEEAHIAVVPGAAFEAPENIRISYSNSLENIAMGMDRMENALAKLQQ